MAAIPPPNIIQAGGGKVKVNSDGSVSVSPASAHHVEVNAAANGGEVMHLTQVGQAATTSAPTNWALRFSSAGNIDSYIYHGNTINNQGDLVIQTGRLFIAGFSLNLSNCNRIESFPQLLTPSFNFQIDMPGGAVLALQHSASQGGYVTCKDITGGRGVDYNVSGYWWFKSPMNDVSGARAYLLDTDQSRTHGKLLEVSNNSSNRFEVDYLGDFQGLGANAQATAINQLTELTTIAAAATTDTTLSIPANVLVLGVSIRVVTVIPTAATFTVTGATSGTTFNTAAVSTAANTTNKGNVAGAYYNTAAQHVRFTPNLTPGAATGQVRVTVHYIDIIPPTS